MSPWSRVTRWSAKPGAVVGTRNALMPPRLAAARAASVTAKTTIQSANVMFDVHILRPLIRQPEPSGPARVVIMVASEPAPGSESPKHMDWRPETRPASARSRASAVSCSSTTLGPKAQWLSAKVPSQWCGPQRWLIASQAT
jgi:hypothetical protein